LKEYKLDDKLRKEGVNIRNDKHLLKYLEKHFVKGKD